MTGRLGWCAALPLLLAACGYPDYTAVRDWAGTAAVVSAWPGTAPRPQSAAAGREAIPAMQAALETWFGALSTLADDGLVRQMTNPLVEAADKVAAADEKAGRGVAALGALVMEASRNNWRAPQTAGAIRAAAPAVQAVLQGLDAAVERLAAEDAPAREAIIALYAPLEDAARDPAARQSILDWRAQREAEVAARAARRDAYRAVLARIAEGDALLLDRAGHLSQDETARRIRAAEMALRRAALLLPPSR